MPEENRIIVLDASVSKTVFVFNTEGKFLFKLGRHGKGPGEYVNPVSVASDKNRIVIYDGSKLALIFYRLDGKFIKEISMPANHWNFECEKMCLWKNDLYIYDNDKYRNEAPDGKHYRIFIIKNCENFEKGYGKYEKTIGYAGGGITALNNRIVYSSIFSGNIYQIFPTENKSTIFASLGVQTNINKYNNLIELLKDRQHLEVIEPIAAIKKLLFVCHSKLHPRITIIDNAGKILKDLPFIDKDPKGYGDVTSRLPFLFYKKGIIKAAYMKNKLSVDYVPNPTLFIYEVK